MDIYQIIYHIGHIYRHFHLRCILLKWILSKSELGKCYEIIPLANPTMCI